MKAEIGTPRPRIVHRRRIVITLATTSRFLTGRTVGDWEVDFRYARDPVTSESQNVTAL